MSSFKVAILGAGNAGCAYATDMSSRGIDVTLIKTSSTMREDNFSYLLKNDGYMTIVDFGENGCMDTSNQFEIKSKINLVTRDVSKISDADVIIVTIQTNYHESLIERIEPYIHDGQVIIMMPGYLSTAYWLKHCKKDITIIEAESSFIDCRILEPGKIKVGFKNVRNPLGIYPYKNYEYAKEKLDKLGYSFVYMKNVVSAALHNPNVIVHTIGAVMSIPMIDAMGEDFCMYHRAFTEHVWNVLEKLDAEKMDILEHLGCPRVSYVEACKFRNSNNEEEDAKQVFFDYASMPTRAKGPVRVDSRYVTEDVPQGLCLLESLGQVLHIETPICSSLINIASASLQRDFRSEGRNINSLGVDNVKTIMRDGVYVKPSEL